MRNSRTWASGLVLALILGTASRSAISQLERDAAPVRPICESGRIVDAGKPLFFEERNGIAFGVSLSKRSFLAGERIPVYIWINNTSDQAYSTGSCGMFAEWNVAVWNNSGERLLSYAERRNIVEGAACDSNVLISTKAHSCRLANEVPLQLDFDIAPGSYRLGELPWSPLTMNSKNGTAPMPTDKNSLLFNVSTLTAEEKPASPKLAKPQNDGTSALASTPQIGLNHAVRQMQNPGLTLSISMSSSTVEAGEDTQIHVALANQSKQEVRPYPDGALKFSIRNENGERLDCPLVVPQNGALPETPTLSAGKIMNFVASLKAWRCPSLPVGRYSIEAFWDLDDLNQHIQSSMPVRIPSNVLSFAVGTSQRSSSNAGAASDDLTGFWQGIWKRPDGDARAVLKINKDLRAWNATLNLVDQPGIRLWIYSLKRNGSKIDSPAAGMSGMNKASYDGVLSNDRNMLDGFLTFPAGRSELHLVRVGADVSAWNVPEPSAEQMHQYLNQAYNRTALIKDHAKPFHMVAHIDFTGKGAPEGSAILDEVWRDPLHWKLAVTYRGDTYIEIDNGNRAFAVGARPKISLSPPLPFSGDRFADAYSLAEAALFRPMRLELLSTRRLKLEDGSFGTKRTCIFAEPELDGISTDTPIAETQYCLSPYDLIPYLAVPPGDPRVTHTDVAPFDGRLIARTITVDDSPYGQVRQVSVHITTLEPFSDFRALRVRAAAKAKQIPPHRQDITPPDEVVHGQMLPVHLALGTPTQVFKVMCQSPKLSKGSGGGSGVEIRLHTDDHGTVTDSEILNDPGAILTQEGRDALKEAVKSYKFRLSYQGARAVADEHFVWTGACVV